ncbi:MAG: hypothetical protein KJ042_00565 [Deltaproteobacteria bacterium]|nr:hypothetical protein [Deltaproteobacteria bacterium]
MKKHAWKRWILWAILAVFATACGQKSEEQATGPDSPEELAQKYLDAIASQDEAAINDLLLSAGDMRKFNKRMNKQGVDTYRQFVLRDFKTKNRDYLGQQLKFVAFRLGQEVMGKDQYGLYRGSTIIADMPDGSKVNLEINFVSRIGQKWKVFSLRYLKDAKGANPGIPDVLPGAKFGPEQKNKVQLKIKKTGDKDDDESPDAALDGVAPAPPAAPPPAPPAAPPAGDAPKDATKP